ncbi:hypothetical protein MO973_18045 [Paenibacillus sp. TRM 82003]|nr:hypothetical protein [Paenibacillus sp. TRM 82003]
MHQSEHAWAAGASGSAAAVSGSWPHTHLELTCRLSDYPGLLLRRREPLFDELGRIAPAPHVGADLMDALETHNLPPAGAAVDGVVDI